MRYLCCAGVLCAACCGCASSESPLGEAEPAAKSSPSAPGLPTPVRENLPEFSPPSARRPTPAPLPAGTPEEPAAAPREVGLPPAEPEPATRFPLWPLPDVDAGRVQGAGIRKLSGQHLTLYTDLPSAPSVDELPVVFDAAVPQWSAYFDIPLEATRDWQLVGYLIQDKDLFRSTGLLPENLPPFLNGYQRLAELWVYEQPSDYYRRHLLLHEGTHAFMNWALGGTGPPWYMEGAAELLATHAWRGDQLTLGYFPQTKEDTPHWGRIKIIQDDLAANRGLTLLQIMQYDHRAHLRLEPYAWCWAAAAFLDGQPAYRAAFRQLRKRVRKPEDEFTQRFCEELSACSQPVSRQWALFAHDLDYGYDLEREAIQSRPVLAAGEAAVTVEVAADRGWQSTGLSLLQGKRYRLQASGRFQIDDRPRVWWCEANGVTMRYHRGLPVGLLLGAVLDEEHAPEDATPLMQPDPVGLGGDLRIDRSGTLYLRINDSPSELGNNAGHLAVSVQLLPD